MTAATSYIWIMDLASMMAHVTKMVIALQGWLLLPTCEAAGQAPERLKDADSAQGCSSVSILIPKECCTISQVCNTKLPAESEHVSKGSNQKAGKAACQHTHIEDGISCNSF